MEELVGGLAVDGVWAVEEFDFGFVAEAEFVVVVTDFGKVPSDPLVLVDAIVVAVFDHEGLRRHQVRQFGGWPSFASVWTGGKGNRSKLGHPSDSQK